MVVMNDPYLYAWLERPHRSGHPRKDKPMFAIVGASGHTGSVVAETLLGQKKAVRVVARDAAKGEPWRARGAEVALAAVDDAAALTRAFAGAQGAYVLLPPNVQSSTPLDDARRVAAAIATAVRAAKLPHLVLLSSVGAEHEGGTGPIRGLHVAEREIGGTGTTLTAIRAAYFMENWAGALGMLDQGALPTFLPAAVPFPQVATRDIGLAAAAALAEPPRASQVIQLAGPRDYSPDDVAAALSALTGKAVTARQAPLDAVVPTFTSFGVSAAIAELFREMYAGIASGHVAFAPESSAVRSVRGTTRIEDVLRGALRA
jgi:uncharacterized protein YbjT (DUF2867 family)